MWRRLAAIIVIIFIFTGCTNGKSACKLELTNKSESFENKPISEDEARSIIHNEATNAIRQTAGIIRSEKQSNTYFLSNSKDPNDTTNETGQLVHNNKLTRCQEQSNKSNFPKVSRLLPEENFEKQLECVTHIVIHFASDASKHPENPYDIDSLYDKFKQYGVPAHYIIDRQGEIFEFVLENKVAYHAGEGKLDNYPHYKNKLSHYSIGIELLAIGTIRNVSA